MGNTRVFGYVRVSTAETFAFLGERFEIAERKYIVSERPLEPVVDLHKPRFLPDEYR